MYINKFYYQQIAQHISHPLDTRLLQHASAISYSHLHGPVTYK